MWGHIVAKSWYACINVKAPVGKINFILKFSTYFKTLVYCFIKKPDAYLFVGLCRIVKFLLLCLSGVKDKKRGQFMKHDEWRKMYFDFES